MDDLEVPPFQETSILPSDHPTTNQGNDHMVVTRMSKLHTWQCAGCVHSARQVCPVFSLQSKIQRCTRVQAGKDLACRESRALNRHQTYYRQAHLSLSLCVLVPQNEGKNVTVAPRRFH